jgi:hypothetical protein
MRFAQRKGTKWSETLEFAGFWHNCRADSGSSTGKSGSKIVEVPNTIVVSQIPPASEEGTWPFFQDQDRMGGFSGIEANSDAGEDQEIVAHLRNVGSKDLGAKEGNARSSTERRWLKHSREP